MGPLQGETGHKTMMIGGETKIFQRGLFDFFTFENLKKKLKKI